MPSDRMTSPNYHSCCQKECIAYNALIKQLIDRGVSSCSSLGWPTGCPHTYLGERIEEVLMHDWVSGVTLHQLCDATLWIQLLCKPATLQPVSLGGPRPTGGRSSDRGPWAHWPLLEPPLLIDGRGPPYGNVLRMPLERGRKICVLKTK